MESYIKAVLYVYPRLEKIKADYGEHIRNRALMSCSYRGATENLCEYLAREIVRKQLIGELKNTLDEVLEKMTEEERFLLELRYFGRKKHLTEYSRNTVREIAGSERNYYRRQEKALCKAGYLLKRAGLTEEVFFREYGGIETLSSVCRYIDEGKERGISPRERSLFRFLADGSSLRNPAAARRVRNRDEKKSAEALIRPIRKGAFWAGAESKPR